MTGGAGPVADAAGPRSGGTLRLRDARELRWMQWGDPNGRPVVHLHGMPGSRLERYPDSRVTAELGIRFVTFDRPGYGGSSPHPGRGLDDCADDVCELADHLELDWFALHGISGGAPFLLCTAARLGARVAGAAVLAGLGPLDGPGALDGLPADNRAAFALAASRPEELEGRLRADTSAARLPPVERSALGRIPGLARTYAAGFTEVARQGVSGLTADYLALARRWPFRPGQLALPVELWHGELDELVPIRHAERLAEAVPGARLHRCPSDGHLSLFGRQREVLGFLARCLDRPTGARRSAG